MGAVTAALSFVGGIVGEFVKDWRAERENKRTIRKASAEFQAEQARSREAYRQAWELRALEGRDALLQRFSFFMLSWPVAWAPIDPEAVREAFKALESLPEWYVPLYGLVLAAVWGISELKQFRAGRR